MTRPLSEQLEEATRESFHGKTSAPGISFKKFTAILSLFADDQKARVSSMMGDAIAAAQLDNDYKGRHNASAIGGEMKQVVEGELSTLGILKRPKPHDYELVATAILWPLFDFRISDARQIKHYQNMVSLEMRNKHPITGQALDRVIHDSSKFLH